MTPRILYEDNHLIVVNKPAAMLTQGDSSGAPSLLDEVKRFLKRRDRKPGNVFVGLVHRLDKPVSGVIVLAKTSKAAGRLSEQIRQRKMEKLYVAVTPVAGPAEPRPGGWRMLDHQVERRGDRTLVYDRPGKGRQPARLQLKTIHVGGDRSYHLVRLVTGRKHQIRAQLAHLGLPLLGDLKYGAEAICPANLIALHALLVGVLHPVRREQITVGCRPDQSFYCGAGQDEIGRVDALLETELARATTG